MVQPSANYHLDKKIECSSISEIYATPGPHLIFPCLFGFASRSFSSVLFLICRSTGLSSTSCHLDGGENCAYPCLQVSVDFCTISPSPSGAVLPPSPLISDPLGKPKQELQLDNFGSSSD